MLLSIWEMRMTISADKSGWILKRETAGLAVSLLAVCGGQGDQIFLV